jgi:hypothetical protein
MLHSKIFTVKKGRNVNELLEIRYLLLGVTVPLQLLVTAIYNVTKVYYKNN